MVKFSKEEEKIIRAAIKKYGEQSQERIAIEELSELIKALCKKGRGYKSNIPEEMADVYIMLRQLEIMHDSESEVQDIAKQKIARLKHRMEGSKKQNG